MIKEVFSVENGNHSSSGKFSISSIGGCWRKKYLELKGLWKDEYDSKTMRAFAIGDMFHQNTVKTLMEKGHSLNLSVVACEVNIPEQHYISGRADIIVSNNISGEQFVADVKSCGWWTYNNISKGIVPENYKNQLLLYLHFFKIKKGYLLFCEKEKGLVEEVLVEYDEKKALSLIKDIEDFFKNYVEKDIEPPPCDGSNPFGCDVCYPKK